MANGKGTVDCRYCKHHWFHRDPPDSLTAQMMCGLWKVAVPRMRYGALNMFCRSYEPVSVAAPALGRLAQQMQDDGILYGIFYNDLARSDLLKRILDLKTKKFLDGHPDDWKAEHGYT